jgi:hypothetical protein
MLLLTSTEPLQALETEPDGYRYSCEPVLDQYVQMMSMLVYDGCEPAAREALRNFEAIRSELQAD